MNTVAKLYFVLFVVASIANLMWFIFEVQEPRRMILAIGYALMSYGTYKSGLTKETLDLGSRYALIVGFVMLLAGLAMGFLP